MEDEFDNFDMSAFEPLVIDEPAEEVQEDEIEIDEQETPEETPEKPAKEISEVEEPEEVAEEDDEQEDTKKSQSTSKNPYSSLASALADEGVLPSFDPEKDKIENVEDFISAFKKEIKNSEFADLTDEQKEYLQAIRSGVPNEVFNQHQAAKTQLSTITPEEIRENEALRKQLIANSYISQGINPEKAEKLAQRSFDIGEDETDALEALEILKTYQKSVFEQEKVAAEQKRQQQLEESNRQLKQLQDTINQQSEIIPGVKITDKVKQTIYDQATKVVGQDKMGKPLNAVTKARLEDPVNFETKLNYLFYVTKGFSDFSKIGTSQKSKAVRELDDFVKGNTFIPSGKAATKNLDYSPELDGFDPGMINNII